MLSFPALQVPFEAPLVGWRCRGGRLAAAMRRGVVLFGVVSIVAGRGMVWAEDPLPTVVPERINRLTDSEVVQRLAYLEQHLDAGRDYAWWWWNGWTAFYSIGAVVEGTRAGLADTDAQRADYALGAVKATAGVIVLLSRPLEAKNGADAVRVLPDTSPAERRRQLAVAEHQLQANSDAAKRRYSWKRHAINLAVNTAGAVIVWQGFGDPSRAWRSAGIAMAVGEAQIWTQPWWPTEDWEEYQRRFDADAKHRVSWNIAPTLGGMAVQVHF